VAALISKIAAARDGDCLEFWGTGNPLRQQLYVKDLCDIITVFVEQYFNTDKPVIVAPNENLSIKEMIDIAIRVSGKEISYKFNGKLDGQYRKDGSNEYLTKIIDYKFTSFEDGIRNTYNSYNKERKV
jgi:GDP-L-fucose synthase